MQVYSLEYSDFGKNDTYTKFFYWFSSISFVLLPVVILGILNFILIQAVRKSRTIRKTMTQNQKTSSARQMQTMRQENRITITLIGVVIVFLICQLPTALVLIYSSFHPNLPKNENALLRAFGNIFNLLVALNAACNFLLYTALSDKYRKYFCAFIFCWKRRGGRGNGAGATLCEPTHAYEMDTMNTTIGYVTRSYFLYFYTKKFIFNKMIAENPLYRQCVRMSSINVSPDVCTRLLTWLFFPFSPFL